MIQVKDVQFGYRQTTPLLKGVCLNVRKGEIMGILGPNGAGKTTLFKLLNGCLKPDSGIVSLQDKPLSSMSTQEIARNMALVPQNPSAPFAFTVRELVTMGRRPWLGGVFDSYNKEDEECIDSALKEAGIDDLSDRVLPQLSGGERQLAFLARAFAQNAEVLLLDEATSNLDIRHQQQVLSVVQRKVEQSGVSVVAIIHDLNVAAGFCDRMIFLKDGMVHGPKKPHELINVETLSDIYHISPSSLSVYDDPFHVALSYSS